AAIAGGERDDVAPFAPALGRGDDGTALGVDDAIGAVADHAVRTDLRIGQRLAAHGLHGVAPDLDEVADAAFSHPGSCHATSAGSNCQTTVSWSVRHSRSRLVGT